MPSYRTIRITEDVYTKLINVVGKLQMEMNRRVTASSVLSMALDALVNQHQQGQPHPQPQAEQSQVQQDLRKPYFELLYITGNKILKDIPIDQIGEPVILFDEKEKTTYQVFYGPLDVRVISVRMENDKPHVEKVANSLGDVKRWLEQCRQKIGDPCRKVERVVRIIEENRASMQLVSRLALFIKDFLTSFESEAADELARSSSDVKAYIATIMKDIGTRWHILCSDPTSRICFKDMLDTITSYIELNPLEKGFLTDAEKIMKCGLKLCPPGASEEQAKQAGCYLDPVKLLRDCAKKVEKIA